MFSYPRPESLIDVTPLRVPFFLAFATRQLGPARHVVVIRRADKLKDAHTLIHIGLAFENRFAFEHLAEDAPHTPHVDGRRVFLQCEQ